MPGIIPGIGPGYRTTTAMFKWILLIAAIGAAALYYIFWEATKEVDQMYQEGGITDKKESSKP